MTQIWSGANIPAATGAAMVPRPRLHRIRFRAVLAPDANLRSQVVPSHSAAGAEAASSLAAGEATCAHHTLARQSWARLRKRVIDLDLKYCPNCGRELNSSLRSWSSADREDLHAPRSSGMRAAGLNGAWPDGAISPTQSIRCCSLSG